MTTVFKVIGYEVKTAEGNFLNSCVFWVYASTEKEAVMKAESYKVNKKYYEILEVIEKIKEDATS